MIEDWQRRIQAEGWTRYIIDEIMEDCVSLTQYRLEIDDHWDTPREFFQRGLRGDCEDIAVFMLATLKNLDYPHQVRIAATRTILGTEHHALLKVEMPDRTWRLFETMPGQARRTDPSPDKVLFEFDEKNIFHLNPVATHPANTAACAVSGR
jgi:transglutaminase-like putative cysteine protease